MWLPGDREERLVCSEILLHPIVFPRKEKANPFPSLLHSPWLSLTMQGFTTTPKTKFKQSENGNGTLESTLMATKKHRKGWITETEPGVRLIHALTPSFLLSFWSFPRLSTFPHGQNLAHTPVLPRAVQVSSTSASPASPRERPALGLGSTKPKISTLEIVSCILRPQTSFSLWELKQFGLSPPHSLLLCLHLGARDAQTAPKLTQGMKLHLEHRPRGLLLLPLHSWRPARECPSRWKNQGLLLPFPDITTPCAHIMAGQVRANPETHRDIQTENLSLCQAELCTLSIPTPPLQFSFLETESVPPCREISWQRT